MEENKVTTPIKQEDIPTKPDKRKNRKPRRQEGFWGGLFALMTKQCIFSAILFALLYGIKISEMPFSKNICSFIKGAVGYEMTVETIKNFTMGLFT